MTKPKTWVEMTDREKGALIQARNEGKLIEEMVHEKTEGLDMSGCWLTWYPQAFLKFKDEASYRIQPELRENTMPDKDPNEFLRALVTNIILGACLAPFLFLAWVIFF